MGKKGRELLRGRPLSRDCYRAMCSGVEYTENGTDYYGCYGLMDRPDNFNEECKACGAFVDNMPPYAEGGTVSETYIHGGMDDSAENVLYPTVKSDGFCAWGEKADA